MNVVVHIHSRVINSILSVLLVFLYTLMSLEESNWTTYPALSASFILGTIDLVVSWHVTEAFAAPIGDVFCLMDGCHIIFNGSFAQHVEPFEDALVGEVQVTVVVMAVLLDSLLLGTLFCDVSLFMTVVAEVVVTSALKKGMLSQSFMMWSQGHPIFGGDCHQRIGNVGITQLFHHLHLFHPPLYSIHLHINCEQGMR